jgi:hypothetical protein
MGFRDWFGRRKPKKAGGANESPLRWFAGRVAENFREQEDVLEVDLGDVDGEIRLRLADGSERNVFVGNIFAEMEGLAPEAKVASAVDHFRSLFELEISDDWESVRSHLCVTIRGASGLRAEREARPVSELLTDVLGVFPVVDGDTAVRYVTAKDLEVWGVDRAAVLESGLEYLRSLGVAVTPYDPDSPNAILMEASEDSFQAARLAIPGLLAEFTSHVNGRPIAAIPHRDLLLVAGDADPAVVGRLCEVAWREYEAAARKISPALYTSGPDGSVVPYPADACPEHYARIRDAHLQIRAVEYAELKQTLDADFEEDGIDKFVASPMLVERAEGQSLLVASWADQCEALLPKVDALAMADGDDIALVPWDEVTRIAPTALVRHPTYQPTLYETSGPPTATALRTLLLERRVRRPAT